MVQKTNMMILCCLIFTSFAHASGGSGGANDGFGIGKEANVVIPRFALSYQFLRSSVSLPDSISDGVESGTKARAISFAGGIELNDRHYHGLEFNYGTDLYDDSQFELDKVWGINYDYYWINDFETDFIYIDLGAKLGYNIYREYSRTNKLIEQKIMYESVRFGGPQLLFRVNFGKFGFGSGYAFMMGYKDVGGEKSFTGTHVWNFQFIIRLIRD